MVCKYKNALLKSTIRQRNLILKKGRGVLVKDRLVCSSI